MASIGDKIKNAWNAFLGRDPTRYYSEPYSSYPRGRMTISPTNLRTIVSTIYNQIAVDCSKINIRHVRLNDSGKFQSIIDDSLNYLLSKSANIDQTGRELFKECVMNLLDKGYVALIPTYTDINPNKSTSFSVLEARVGQITEWSPKKIRVDVYNDDTGMIENIEIEKRYTVIIENPFYEIMNEQNSTAKRYMRVLNQLSNVNEQSSSGKLDLIIQFPYIIKTEKRREEAEKRRKDIEAQLNGSERGIAYTDGSERVIQLNRPIDNNLWTQERELRTDLFNQLGFSQTILDGTADEQTMLNYYNRTIEPILSAITEEIERKWLSKTAQTQKQAIRFFRDPFKLVPVIQLAEIVDKFTRNEIMSSNEFRSIMGLKPSSDPKADELRNSNLNHPENEEVSTPSNPSVNDDLV